MTHLCLHCGAENCKTLRDELSLYTLSRGDTNFVHQYVVDAYAAQHATENTKPITTAFALIGLYLLTERNYTGREVQQAHMMLANRTKDWPIFPAAERKADLNVSDVLRAEPGEARDMMIKTWAMAVWDSWKNEHEHVARLVKSFDFLK